MNRTRIAAVIAKELREYRRNRFLVGSMIVYPAIFTALPIATFFARQPSGASAALTPHIGLSLLYLLIIPVAVPATISGFAIVGEREAGTLEPLLTTPIRPEEILIGKATAIAMPTLVIAYAVYGLFLLAVELFAHSFVASAVFNSNEVLAQPVFIPLLAAWSIWVGIAISTRASDVRVAQQLTILGSLPPVALTSLMGFDVINPTLTLAVVLAAALLAVDLAGWRLVAVLFNRERLITGSTPHHPHKPSRKADSLTRRKDRPAEDTPPERRATLSATLTLTREGTGIELRRGPFEVTVDGNNLGSIQRHETVEESLEPGHHTLRLQAGRYSSQVRSFDVSDGEVIRFRCHGAMVWPRYVASILKPDLAISLRRQ